MSTLKSQVGKWKLNWKSLPRGPEGSAWVDIQGHGEVEVHWRVDSQGISIQTESGISGFDLKAELDESGQKVYSVVQRNIHAEWSGVTVSLGEAGAQTASRVPQVKVTRLKAQMPGKMIRVMVKLDQIVEKDQPLMVMEAMKMENEIRAPVPGRVSQVHVIEGQAVETGAELLRIDPLT